MDTLQTYDELPYDRLTIPETEPDFLAAIAHLHGFETANARAARVLELGCAQGGNLIPLAARYPDSQFVGIDLSRGQVKEGQSFIARVGLTNIRLLHGDIAALPTDLGQFDFIIAHGVYSWIPEFVRAELLAACRRLLAPQGVAYISFNVEAGWRIYGQIRDMLIQQDDSGLPPMQRVERAKALLAAQPFSNEALQKEANYLLTASPAYLFHEYLSDINQAFSIETFVRQATTQGLRYLGEAGSRRARIALDNDWGLSAEMRHQRWLEAEANLDAALDTRFRRALLVRDDAVMPGLQSASRLHDLAFSAELTSDDELDFAQADTQTFRTRTGEQLPVSHPLLKAFLVVLSGAWPQVLDYQSAFAQAHALACEYGHDGLGDAAFDEALLDFAELHGLRLHVLPRSHCVEPGEKPVSTRLAQVQSSLSGWPVTNIFHQSLDLDEWGRWLLTMMDGSLDVRELAIRLKQKLAAGGIEASPEQAEAALFQYLEFFTRQGLLR